MHGFCLGHFLITAVRAIFLRRVGAKVAGCPEDGRGWGRGEL